MSETQGVIKKNSTINPNRENLSSVKNLSHNICDCGTSVFTRELLLLVCASPYHAARGRQHPVQWEQRLVILCSQEGRLVVFCKAVCCENRRYLQSYLWSVSICIVLTKAPRAFPMEKRIHVCVPVAIWVSSVPPYWWYRHRQSQLASALRKMFVFT